MKEMTVCYNIQSIHIMGPRDKILSHDLLPFSLGVGLTMETSPARTDIDVVGREPPYLFTAVALNV